MHETYCRLYCKSYKCLHTIYCTYVVRAVLSQRKLLSLDMCESHASLAQASLCLILEVIERELLSTSECA